MTNKKLCYTSKILKYMVFSHFRNYPLIKFYCKALLLCVSNNIFFIYQNYITFTFKEKTSYDNGII